MKVLVVYYSYDGNTRLVAEEMARATGGELLDLRPVGEKRHRGLAKLIWGGFQVLTRKMPRLEPCSKDFQAYDFILLGSPVWAGSYAPAMRSFLSTRPFSGRKIGLFCCYGGSAGKLFANLRQALRGNEILGEKGFRDPIRVRTDEVRKEAQEWARKLVG